MDSGHGEYTGEEKVDKLEKDNLALVAQIESLISETERKNIKPHTCPVCDGCGEVPDGFYRRSYTGDIKCRSCEGKGIVWNNG